MLKDSKGLTINLGDTWTFQAVDYVLHSFNDELWFTRTDSLPDDWIEGMHSEHGELKTI